MVAENKNNYILRHMKMTWYSNFSIYKKTVLEHGQVWLFSHYNAKLRILGQRQYGSQSHIMQYL